jgi:glycosyltransferase involved in cell wall biosynthesis
MPSQRRESFAMISVVIPTRNSEQMLKKCLSSIRDQTLDEIEVIIVDNLSTDKTRAIAAQYGAKTLTVGPQISNFFAAPIQRRIGAEEAVGKYLYFVDSDMVLQEGLLKECLLTSTRYDALIIPEQSVGTGTWARARIAERACHFGDSALEAPRFVSKVIYEKVGKWPQEAGAFDDWAFRDRLVSAHASIGRTEKFVLHDEGDLRISRLLRRKLIMGMSIKRVPPMRSRERLRRMSPVRIPSVLSQLARNRPDILPAFLVMRSLEGVVFYAGRAVAQNRRLPNSLVVLNK